jgi:hypothetical protein
MSPLGLFAPPNPFTTPPYRRRRWSGAMFNLPKSVQWRAGIMPARPSWISGIEFLTMIVTMIIEMAY